MAREKTIVGINISNVRVETPKAILVDFLPGISVTHSDGRTVESAWFPLSLVSRITHPSAANNNVGILYVERWIVEKNFPDDAESLIIDLGNPNNVSDEEYED